MKFRLRTHLLCSVFCCDSWCKLHKAQIKFNVLSCSQICWWYDVFCRACVIDSFVSPMNLPRNKTILNNHLKRKNCWGEDNEFLTMFQMFSAILNSTIVGVISWKSHVWRIKLAQAKTTIFKTRFKMPQGLKVISWHHMYCQWFWLKQNDNFEKSV